jgi:hypothetical protein
MSGRYSSVGKNLALAELRFVTAMLVRKYVLEFPVGEGGSRVGRDMRDQFTAAPGKLNLRFTIGQEHRLLGSHVPGCCKPSA